MRRSTNDPHLITLTNPQSYISEAYRKLRTNIQFSSIDQTMQVLMVASTKVEEGKTTTLSNLAITYAQEGKNVLLIDADLRRPSLHRIFAQSNRIGLTSVLADQAKWGEVVKLTEIENLSLITSGQIPPNPSELLGSSRMQALIDDLKEEYDVILIDTPPVLAVTDSLIVSALCDGVILVVAAGKVEKELVRRAKASLDYVNAKIIGTVLNKMSRKEMKTTIYAYGASTS